MAKYIPTPAGIKYKYLETTGSEKTIIESIWNVELSADETIDIKDPIDTGTHVYIVELNVKSTGGPSNDHTWTEPVNVEICPDQEYDPNVVADLSEKINIVRDKVLSLLSFYNSTQYIIIANVTREGVTSGNKNSNTISGSGTLVID